MANGVAAHRLKKTILSATFKENTASIYRDLTDIITAYILLSIPMWPHKGVLPVCEDGTHR